MIVQGFAGPGGTPDECWDQIGTEHGNGYRRMRLNGRAHYVHRLAYEQLVGPIPTGLVLDHANKGSKAVNQ